MGSEFRFFKMKRVMEMDGGEGCTQDECTSYHRTEHSKMIKIANFMLCVFCHNKNIDLQKVVTSCKESSFMM